jgi:small subunit ribosomal protein S17
MADRKVRKMRTGVVVSDGRDKTITVEVSDVVRHARYSKTVRRRKRLHVHDEENDARMGDTVRVMETRPLSKTKRWRVIEVVERAR